MIYYQQIETRSRNGGHTEEDEHTEYKGPEFMLHSRVVITQHQEDEQHGTEANGDGSTRAQQDASNYRQRSHIEVSHMVYLQS